MIVNSTGTKVNLSSPTCRVLAEKAGPELAKACSKLRPLKSGLVKETDAYQIRTCKKIFHCHCPKYKNGDKEVRRVF